MIGESPTLPGTFHDMPLVVVNASDPVRTAYGGGCAIMTTPAVYPPPRGAEALAEWARTWKKHEP